MSKKSDWLIDNPLTMHKHARWIALGFYLAGCVCMLIASLIDGAGGAAFAIATFVLWIVPVMWGAHMYAKHGW